MLHRVSTDLHPIVYFGADRYSSFGGIPEKLQIERIRGHHRYAMASTNQALGNLLKMALRTARIWPVSLNHVNDVQRTATPGVS